MCWVSSEVIVSVLLARALWEMCIMWWNIAWKRKDFLHTVVLIHTVQEDCLLRVIKRGWSVLVFCVLRLFPVMALEGQTKQQPKKRKQMKSTQTSQDIAFLQVDPFVKLFVWPKMGTLVLLFLIWVCATSPYRNCQDADDLSFFL